MLMSVLFYAWDMIGNTNNNGGGVWNFVAMDLNL
jgi:hypothetical protein